MVISHHLTVNARQRSRARLLRRQMTDAENALWRLLRDRRLGGIKFRRQAPFGPFVLDFVCFERKLVVEVDGGQHGDSYRDWERDAYLAKAGLRVIRYWNNDVLGNREGVLTDLLAQLSRSGHPSPGSSLREEPPSPTRGEG